MNIATANFFCQQRCLKRNYSSGRGILFKTRLRICIFGRQVLVITQKMAERHVSESEGKSPDQKASVKHASERAAGENKVVKLLEKNPLGMTLPEMAGGPRQLKKLRSLRPLLAEAIKSGMVMPISQRAGHTVYRLVKYLGHR
jgi:hypothetical protein